MDQLLNGLKAAAEPTRLRLLALCGRGELSVSDLTAILGQSQPRVSRHLRLLADAGLLDRFREGTFAYFRLAEQGPCAALARSLVDLMAEDDPDLAMDLRRLETIKAQRAQVAAAYFRDNAARWDELRALHIADSEVERCLIELLPEGEIGDLVDLGTGTGRMLALLGRRARRAVGIDSSREMLSVARANLERERVANTQVRLGDLYQLPLPDRSFDVAVIHHVLHYMEDPLDVLCEAARVLRPGGRLLLADFAAHQVDSLRSEHAHRWLGFADEQVAAWLRDAGFEADGPIHLAGDPLTVTIWPARREAGETDKAPAEIEPAAVADGQADTTVTPLSTRRLAGGR
jgi:ArsR family transcriptional regulator